MSTYTYESAQALEDHLEKSQSHPKGHDNELAYWYPDNRLSQLK